jgi:transmembrane sensor
MHSANTDNLPSDVIKEAAAWLSRLQEKPLSIKEQHAFDTWRAQNPQHEQAWLRAQLLAEKLGHIPAGLGMKMLGRPQSNSRRNLMKLVVVGVPTGIIAQQALPWQAWSADHQTAKGEQQNIKLADGSKLVMNTNSAVDINYNAQQRLIRLYQGEVYIESSHDIQNRPLLVETEHGKLRALGTQFVVRKQAQSTYLGVAQGAVEITPAGGPTQSVIVQAGHEAHFSKTDIQNARPLNDNAIGWLQGVLYADNMPLVEFIEQLSRYRAGVLMVDKSAFNVRISGAFQLNNPDKILETLTQTRPLTINWRTRYWGTIYQNG